MKYEPLKREEVKAVIEGRGAAARVPVFVHFWTHPEAFDDEKRARIMNILNEYPQDADMFFLNIPQVYEAPADDPSYRWSYRDCPASGAKALDQSGFIEDWDNELELLLKDFPSADYPGLIPEKHPDDGRYRIGCWWYFFFERFWSIRNMQEALIDFYDNPEAVHALFSKLCDFYIRMIERAKAELDLDGIFTSDDLGTQTGTFFSTEIFDEFFAPYYKKVIDKVHELGMHFWLHTCGNIENFLERYIELGVDVIHPIQKYTMDEKKIAGKYGDRITIWAGFDVQRIIPYGTADEVRQEVRFLTDTYVRPDGRFMFTLGNGTTKDLPEDSFAALLDEIFTYGSRKTAQIKGDI